LSPKRDAHRSRKRLHLRLLTLVAVSGLALGLMSATANAAPPSPTSSSIVDSGDGWTVEQGAGGYVITLKLDAPLPVNDDVPVLVADGKTLGPATESTDGLSLSLTTTDPAVATAGQIAWAWLSSGDADTSTTAASPTATPKVAPKSAAVKPKASSAEAAPATAISADPTTPGPFAYTEAVYNFGAQAIPLANIGGIRGEVEGKIYLPTGGGAHPLVIFLHGRHSSCFKSDPTAPNASGWPCPTGYSEIPSYAGYDGAGEALASNGYTVVSIGADAINSNDNQLAPDDGAVARGQLVLDNLTWLQKANLGQAVSFFDAAKNQTLTLDQALAGTGLTAASLKGTMNFSDIGLMGHSRGGEGVVTAGTLNEGLAKPWAIKSIFALAPIDFTRATLPDVITTTLLPYCDGDVSDQQGQHFYSDSRDNFDDNVLRSNIWVMGADHDFFNQIWTPPFPSASDDWSRSTDPVCGAAAPTTTRLSPTQEFDVGSAYVAGFFELTLGGQKQFQGMFDGSGDEPSSVSSFADVRTIADQPASQRDDLASFEANSPLIGTAGTATATVCANKTGRTVPEPYPACSVTSLTNQQVPHWTPAAFAPNVPLGIMTHLTWTSGTGKLTVTVPKAQQNASTYQELTVDMSPDENVPAGTDMTMTVSDSSGHTWSSPMSALNPFTVNRMPQSTGTGATLLGKIVLQQAHVPTATLAAAGLNLKAITAVSFTAAVGLDQTPAGGVYISDLGFDTKGLGTPNPQSRPTVNVASTKVEEGNGPGTADIAVYLSKPAKTTVTAYLSAIGSATGKVGLAMQQLTFKPGQTCQAVTVATLGDTTPSATPSTAFKMAVSDSTNAVLGINDYATLTVREDDGTTGTAAPAPTVGVQGDVCAEFAALSKPGALGASSSKPAAGQSVTFTGKGYRADESVAFSVGTTLIGSAIAGDNGKVSFTGDIPASAAGTTATVSGIGAGSGYTSSTSIKVGKVQSAITLTLTPSTTYGTAATGTVAVAGVTSGTVAISYGGKPFSVAFDSTGPAAFSLPATLAAGKYKVSASFAATDTATSSSATLSLSIVKASTTLALRLGAPSAVSGKNVPATVTVGGFIAGLYPSGSVTVTVRIGSSSKSTKIGLDQSDAGTETESISVPSGTGLATVTAIYNGDNNYLTSNSDAVSLTLTKK
jgi:trimeric autotransporter adhesin